MKFEFIVVVVVSALYKVRISSGDSTKLSQPIALLRENRKETPSESSDSFVTPSRAEWLDLSGAPAFFVPPPVHINANGQIEPESVSHGSESEVRSTAAFHESGLPPGLNLIDPRTGKVVVGTRPQESPPTNTNNQPPAWLGGRLHPTVDGTHAKLNPMKEKEITVQPQATYTITETAVARTNTTVFRKPAGPLTNGQGVATHPVYNISAGLSVQLPEEYDEDRVQTSVVTTDPFAGWPYRPVPVQSGATENNGENAFLPPDAFSPDMHPSQVLPAERPVNQPAAFEAGKFYPPRVNQANIVDFVGAPTVPSPPRLASHAASQAFLRNQQVPGTTNQQPAVTHENGPFVNPGISGMPSRQIPTVPAASPIDQMTEQTRIVRVEPTKYSTPVPMRVNMILVRPPTPKPVAVIQEPVKPVTLLRPATTSSQSPRTSLGNTTKLPLTANSHTVDARRFTDDNHSITTENPIVTFENALVEHVAASTAQQAPTVNFLNNVAVMPGPLITHYSNDTWNITSRSPFTRPPLTTTLAPVPRISPKPTSMLKPKTYSAVPVERVNQEFRTVTIPATATSTAAAWQSVFNATDTNRLLSAWQASLETPIAMISESPSITGRPTGQPYPQTTPLRQAVSIQSNQLPTANFAVNPLYGVAPELLAAGTAASLPVQPQQPPQMFPNQPPQPLQPRSPQPSPVATRTRTSSTVERNQARFSGVLHLPGNVTVLPNEENYCDSSLADRITGLGLRRVEHFLANVTCSPYFYMCAEGFTYRKNCPSHYAFDFDLRTCNYRYNVPSCPEYDHEIHCTIKDQCRDSQFACCEMPQRCIEYTTVCDGVHDCAGGADETNCHACEAWEFSCIKSSKCIPWKQRCDGYDDCQDGTFLDEAHCSGCGAGRFFCSRSNGTLDQTCLDEKVRCNGQPDCPLGEDELNCKGKGPASLLCENQRQRVDKKQWCDGYEDCKDGSDEKYCF